MNKKLKEFLKFGIVMWLPIYGVIMWFFLIYLNYSYWIAWGVTNATYWILMFPIISKGVFKI